MSISNVDPFDKERFITDEFEVGEEIIIVSMSAIDSAKVAFVNKAIVSRGMKLRKDYHGVRFIFHGYEEYKIKLMDLISHEIKEYKDITLMRTFDFCDCTCSKPLTVFKHADASSEDMVKSLMGLNKQDEDKTTQEN